MSNKRQKELSQNDVNTDVILWQLLKVVLGSEIPSSGGQYYSEFGGRTWLERVSSAQIAGVFSDRAALVITGIVWGDGMLLLLQWA